MAIFTDSFKYLLLVCILIQTVYSSNQMVIYWGQNSVGSFSNVPSQQEKPLRNYCQDSSFDIIVVGFVYLFPSASGNADPTLPGMNFANHCEVPFNSQNPFVLNCTANIAPDIEYCQSRGKKIMLSFGGGVGTYGFTSDAQAITFANTVWNMFLGGTHPLRPFGNAIFDGIDLDIEGGSQTGYIQFIATLRAFFAAQTSRNYYISSAPQCFYPDRLGPGAGTPLTQAWFDYIWIQFYNNHCGLDEPANFNFARWVTGMANAANPNVKLFIGAPASANAAGSGFISLSALESIASTIAAAYPSQYGGIMVWDASTSDLNNNFGQSVAAFVHAANSVIAPITPVNQNVGTTGQGRVSTPVAAGTTAAAPKVAPISVPVPVPVTPTPVPVTPAPVSPLTSTGSSSDNAKCVQGYMRCLSPSTYSTCDRGIWGVAQSCGANSQCASTGNYIYCVASSAPISAPSSPVVPVAPVTPTPTPVPVTQVPTATVTPTTPANPTSGSCLSLGYQQCVGTNGYQTCSNGRDGLVWSATQFCQKGLSCNPSATANNIYCY